MIGKTISHYTILEEIGSGGMGIVYKAEDINLERHVALKFLPPELTRDNEARERFIHEAKSASALDHPNICTIHEIGKTEDNQMFIAMGYYEGETLKDKIAKGPLKIDEALDITIQIATGLEKAHKKEIVHRDIKPANVFITEDNVVKILDFGLAKLSGQTKLTKDGSTLGTVAYMSPEQTTGEETDSRSDIWSLGVVLFEMISGQLPFKGDYEQAMQYSIVNEEPEPITGLRTGVPLELERIVNKTMAKNPDERFQHVDKFLVDLKNLKKEIQSDKSKQPTQKKGITNNKKLTIFGSIITFSFVLIICGYFLWPNEKTPTIVVFPFSNLSNETNDQNIGLSFAAEIISNLAYTKSLSVRSFNEVRKYVDEEINIRTARNDQKADFMLTGGYFLKDDNALHLIIELTDVHKNNLVWGETFDVSYADWQRHQDLVSENVINNLDLHVSQTEINNIHADVSHDPDAYAFYLRSLSYPFSIDGCSLAIKMLNNSIQLDSTYAPAFEELGWRTNTLAEQALNLAEEYNKAEQYFKKALSLNNQLLSALCGLAAQYNDIGRTDEAMERLGEALNINPNYAWTHFAFSYIYRYTGMLNESEKEMEKALKLDSNNPRFRSAAYTYLYLGKYDKALETSNLDKGSVFTLHCKGGIFLREGKRDSALTCFNRILEMEPGGQTGLRVAGKKAYIEGDIKEGLWATQQSEQEGTYDAESLYETATSYSLLGDKTGCVRVLQKVVDGGFFNYPFMLSDPFLNPMRGDPEFQKVLALAKQKHEAFKKKYFPE